MEIVNFSNRKFNVVGASGNCPNCGVRSYLKPVGGSYEEGRTHNHHAICSPAQCKSCKNFVLVVGVRGGVNPAAFELVAVYPQGKPDDFVAESVLLPMRENF